MLIVYDPEPTDHYLTSFAWNKVRYRSDKPLGELVDMLQKVSAAQVVPGPAIDRINRSW